MKKLILLTSVAMLFLGITKETKADKICDCGSTENGGSVSDCCWEINNKGTLIISGTGKMKDYTPSWKNTCGDSNTPTWCSQIDNINSVEIKGMEYVGSGVMYSAYNKPISLKLDDSIKTIGNYALRFNYPIIELPDSITTIGAEALKSDTETARTIIIPDTLKTIHSGALGYTEKLNNLNIICKGSNCNEVIKLFENYHTYSDVVGGYETVNLGNKVTLANETNCDSVNYYWNGITCLREENPKNRECVGGYAKIKDRCVDPLKTFAKKHYTPAEAAEWLHDGNDNFVIITFKK